MPIVATTDDICTFCLCPGKFSFDIPGFSSYSVCGCGDCKRTGRYFQLLKENTVMKTQGMITMTDFLGLFSKGLKFQFEEVSDNPHINDMPMGSRHYRCRFRFYPEDAPKANRKQYTMYFSKGPAHDYGVTADEALDAIAGDVGSIEGTNNAIDFASEFEARDRLFDEDVMRRYEKIYNTICSHRKRILNLLGDHWMTTLLCHVERR